MKHCSDDTGTSRILGSMLHFQDVQNSPLPRLYPDLADILQIKTPVEFVQLLLSDRIIVGTIPELQKLSMVDKFALAVETFRLAFPHSLPHPYSP
jgi:hypothetical protein